LLKISCTFGHLNLVCANLWEYMRLNEILLQELIKSKKRNGSLEAGAIAFAKNKELLQFLCFL
jgi:hypothetical protein